MKKENLIGQRFSKLTVISEGESIPASGRSSYVSWNCQCDCGKIINVRAGTLKSGAQKSCGCTALLSGKRIKAGDKFNKLTAVSYQAGKWICQCECGKVTKPILTSLLYNGVRKSCGCIKVDVAKANLEICMKSVRKFDKRTASARRRWKSYCYSDKKCNITFDQWMEISKKNCHYCGSTPGNNFSYVKNGKKEEDSYFTYNGLDRVDSSQPHVIENVVPCCIICNRAKSNRSLEEWQEYMGRLIVDFSFREAVELELPTGGMLVSVKDAYRHYKRNYGEMGLTLQQFYNMSQMPCSYCGVIGGNCINNYKSSKKSSKAAIDSSYFYYNGIDRVDNCKDHSVDNVVPCCRYCNFGKGNLSLEEWNNWVRRVKLFNKSA